MKIVQFIYYLIFPISVLSSNIYSASNNISNNYQLFGQGETLQKPLSEDTDFHGLISYTHLSSLPKNSSDIIKVHKYLGNPNSELVNIYANNSEFSLSNENQQEFNFQNHQCGIVKFENEYYLAFYVNNGNVREWSYLDDENDHILAGYSSNNENVKHECIFGLTK